MGWKEALGTAATYNRRHIKEKAKEEAHDAKEAAYDLLEKVENKAAETQNSIEEKIEKAKDEMAD